MLELSNYAVIKHYNWLKITMGLVTANQRALFTLRFV